MANSCWHVQTPLSTHSRCRRISHWNSALWTFHRRQRWNETDALDQNNRRWLRRRVSLRYASRMCALEWLNWLFVLSKHSKWRWCLRRCQWRENRKVERDNGDMCVKLSTFFKSNIGWHCWWFQIFWSVMKLSFKPRNVSSAINPISVTSKLGDEFSLQAWHHQVCTSLALCPIRSLLIDAV